MSAQGLAFKTNYPAKLTFDSNDNLWVCDVLNYRVLRFPASNLNTTGGPISADVVIGQQSLSTTYSTIPSGTAAVQTTSQFGLLGGIGFDPQGRLYVGDNLGNRIGAGTRFGVWQSFGSTQQRQRRPFDGCVSSRHTGPEPFHCRRTNS